MKAKTIFDLAVRLIGVLFVCRAVWSLPEIVGMILGGGVGNFMMAVLSVVCPLLVGYWFLHGAPPVTDIAYPDGDDDEPQPFRASEKRTDI